jgi:hypothetical protein
MSGVFPKRTIATVLRRALQFFNGFCKKIWLLPGGLWRKELRRGRRAIAIMLVGEQPGNDEDLSGKPFVGPAGRLLDASLAEAGIDRKKVYGTNVVKHFKWEPRGKRASIVYFARAR